MCALNASSNPFTRSIAKMHFTLGATRRGYLCADRSVKRECGTQKRRRCGENVRACDRDHILLTFRQSYAAFHLSSGPYIEIQSRGVFLRCAVCAGAGECFNPLPIGAYGGPIVKHKDLIRFQCGHLPAP